MTLNNGREGGEICKKCGLEKEQLHEEFGCTKSNPATPMCMLCERNEATHIVGSRYTKLIICKDCMRS